MANFLSFLENATSGGTKRCVDLNSASTYSSCNILHHKMPYNKISIVMDLFDLYGIPKVFKNPSILRKLDLFQLRLLQGILVYLYELHLCENHKFFKIESASRQEIHRYLMCLMNATNSYTTWPKGTILPFPSKIRMAHLCL